MLQVHHVYILPKDPLNTRETEREKKLQTGQRGLAAMQPQR